MTNELMRILEKCRVIREQVELSLQRMNDSYIISVQRKSWIKIS
jgi:hypothetical protein